MNAEAVFTLLALTLLGADWPQWRGPTGQGISAESPLPTNWNAQSANIRWKAQIRGDGNSSPIVSGDRVYLTTAYEGAMRNRSEQLIAWLSAALAALVLFMLVRSR